MNQLLSQELVEIQEKVLRVSFDKRFHKTRKGASGTLLTYVSWDHYLQAILNAGVPFDVDIVSQKLVDYKKKRRDQPDQDAQVWITNVRVTIEGLGSRVGVGTHPAMDEEAPKVSATDALKRALSLFGIGLELYGDEESAEYPHEPTPRSYNSGGAVVGTPLTERCPDCNAPAGAARHASTCKRGG